jgi:hypothetical protein
MKESMMEVARGLLANRDWKKLGTQTLEQCADLAADGAIWMTGIVVLGIANAAVGFLPLHGRQREMLEAIQLNTMYAVVLVASASIISRLVVSALERLGHWERGE